MAEGGRSVEPGPGVSLRDSRTIGDALEVWPRPLFETAEVAMLTE
jgi:hypothetical protein